MQHDVFPLEEEEDFFLKRDISVIQKYSTAVMHTWDCLLLLPVLEQVFKNIQNFGNFCVFQGIFRPAFRTNIYDAS